MHHEIYHLDAYRNASKIGWDNSQQVALSKRLYLFDMIRATANRSRQGGTDKEKLLSAAHTLDAARSNMSMAAYYTHLKNTDGKKRKRGAAS
jgi:hypothetical protein